MLQGSIDFQKKLLSFLNSCLNEIPGLHHASLKKKPTPQNHPTYTLIETDRNNLQLFNCANEEHFIKKDMIFQQRTKNLGQWKCTGFFF